MPIEKLLIRSGLILAKHSCSMRFHLNHSLALLASSLLVLAKPAPAGAETDFGQVSMHVANMLQNNHYSRFDFNDELSQRLLDNYLRTLDYNRKFFTQADVDGFYAEYGDKLDDQILMEDVSAAHRIYAVYEKRVRDRIAKVIEQLKREDLDFGVNEEIEISRKDSPWPKDEADADDLWLKSIKNQILQEELRLYADEKGGASPEDETFPDPGVSPPKKGENGEDEDEDVRDILSKRWDRILKSLEDNDEEEVVNLFLSSLAMSYDPHSDYFSHRELENFEISMRHSLTGIGAMLSMVDGMAEIQGLVVGGPAHKSSQLEVNDRIIAVGQGVEGKMEDIIDMKLPKVVELIRGTEGTVVRLKVVPAGGDVSQAKEVQIVRDTVELKDKLANAELILTKDNQGREVRLGWIYLSSFYADMNGGSTSTTTDVGRLLERLKKENIEGLVIDLRGNGGGSLEEAINLTGLFIPRGPVVQSKDWRKQSDFRRSRNRYPVYDGPLFVLTDKASASASEILAAALQDYNRAVIIGEQSTFGKGTVQTIMPVSRQMPFFSDKDRAGALKVTIQKFYRIAGGSTQLQGVIPDISLPSRTDALEIGEDSLDNALGYDEIARQEYVLFQDEKFPTDELTRRVMTRVAHDPEFQYIIDDGRRIKDRIDKNVVSLNREERLKEADENRIRLDERDAERRVRYEKTGEAERGLFETFKLTLDNVDETTLTLRDDFSDEESSGMIMAKEGDEEESLEYPHGYDPVKRETLNILLDLLEIRNAEAAQTAKVSGTPAVEKEAVPRVP